MAGFVPILPTRSPIDPGGIKRRLRYRMEELVKDTNRELAEYEAPEPDPRVYIRRHILAGSWSYEVRYQGRDLVGITKSSSKTAPYNKWVRGTKTQAARMKRRGWRTVKQIADNHWPAAKRDFKKILSTPR